MKALLLPPGAGHGAAQLPVTFQRGRQSLGFQCPPSLMEESLEKNWWMSSMVISLIFTSMGPSVEQEKQRGEDLLWCWGSSCCIPVHQPQHSAAFLQHQQKQSGNAAGVTPQPPQPLWLLLDALHVSPPPGVPLCSSLRVSSRLNPPPQQRTLLPLETFCPKSPVFHLRAALVEAFPPGAQPMSHSSPGTARGWDWQHCPGTGSHPAVTAPGKGLAEPFHRLPAHNPSFVCVCQAMGSYFSRETCLRHSRD